MNKFYYLSLLFFAVVSPAISSTFYVSTTGADTNPGTLDKPFASIQKAQENVAPGDIVFIRGGRYVMTEAAISKRQGIYAYVHNMDKSGTASAPIKYWAYKNEKPVFDFSNVKPDARVVAFFVTGSFLHFKGFEVVGVQVTLLNHTQSESFENRGSNNIYEQLSMHDSQAIGFYLISGSNNLVLNCDAYNNYDYTSEGGKGGNSDGFGCHGKKGDVNNVFRGCRAWFNSDDGYDCINSFEPVVFENCWAFYNGYSTSFKNLADGNGFKAGGYGISPSATIPAPVPRNTIRFCLAVRNKANGFYSNHHMNGSDWFNNSAYANTVNFNMLNRQGNEMNVPGYAHKMRNNLGFKAKATEVDKIDTEKSDVAGNYFNLNVTVNEKDFLSLDEALLIKPRKGDGSLPDINFMRLAKGSDLIDSGTDVSFPFKGKRPDLGYAESNY